jgi:hypothetical protein
MVSSGLHLFLLRNGGGGRLGGFPVHLGLGVELHSQVSSRLDRLVIAPVEVVVSLVGDGGVVHNFVDFALQVSTPFFVQQQSLQVLFYLSNS